MIKFEVIDKERNFAMLSFAALQMPTFKVDKANGWVEFGKKNDFPNQLLKLYEEHAEHAAIIGSKSNYLLGEAIIAKNKEQQPLVDSFMSFANPKETWYKLNQKTKIDCELFNAFYLQVVTDLTGKPIEYYHLQYANCRMSKCKTKIWYSEDWMDRACERRPIEKFEGGKPGVFFIRFEFYKPTQNKIEAVYPMPQYVGCLKDISTDIDISTFNNNYVANGFSAGTLVTFFNGVPTADEKKKIKERLLNTHSSPDKAGSIVVNYADKDGQAAQITALNVDDLDKKFEFTSKRALEKILRGHNVTNPELFGVKTEGQLGTRVSLSESYELMINTYTKPRQTHLLDFFSDLIYITTGQTIELDIKQLKAIGLDLTQDQDLTQDERRALKGYEPLTAKPTDVNGQPVPVQAEATGNEFLSKLSRKQINNLFKTVNDYHNGKSTKMQVMILLQSFGLSQQQAEEFLVKDDNQEFKAAMSANDDSIYLSFEKSAIELDSDFELLFEEEVHIGSPKEALQYELKAAKMYFADALSVSITDLKNAILNALKGNPTMTIDELKRLYQVDESLITKALDDLKASELIEPNARGYEPTQKAYNKETEPIEVTEIKTVYSYAVKASAPALSPGGSSRPFCKKMMKLSEGGKRWTFEAIDDISNEMGMNAWDYRGGFYTNPNTGDVDPFCRHIWKAHTIKVKTKK